MHVFGTPLAKKYSPIDLACLPCTTTSIAFDDFAAPSIGPNVVAEAHKRANSSARWSIVCVGGTNVSKPVTIVLVLRPCRTFWVMWIGLRLPFLFQASPQFREPSVQEKTDMPTLVARHPTDATPASRLERAGAARPASQIPGLRRCCHSYGREARFGADRPARYRQGRVDGQVADRSWRCAC